MKIFVHNQEKSGCFIETTNIAGKQWENSQWQQGGEKKIADISQRHINIAF